MELRTALSAVYTARGQTSPAYTDPTLTAQTTLVREAHITEIRTAILVVAGVCTPDTCTNEGPIDEAIEYYHQDAVGSVRTVTDEVGAVVRTHDCFPFGEGVSAIDGYVQRYADQEGDPESGLSYFGARYYRAWTGRFTTVDPVFAGVSNPQRWNRYAYALNNPTVYVDPTGLFGDSCLFPCDHAQANSSNSWLYNFYFLGWSVPDSSDFYFGPNRGEIQRGRNQGNPDTPETPTTETPDPQDDPPDPTAPAPKAAKASPADTTQKNPAREPKCGSDSSASSVYVFSGGGSIVPALGLELSGGLYWVPETGEFGVFGSRGLAVGLGAGLALQGGWLNQMSNFRGETLTLNFGASFAWGTVTKNSSNTEFTGAMGGVAPFGQKWGAYAAKPVTTVLPLGTIGCTDR
jgi:RHS repeat-associated protein